MGMATTFLGDASPTDPLANPLYADLAGLPPMLIQVGGDETLLDDSHRFAERARAAGVEVTVEVYPEMQHVFHFMAGNAPEADDAVAKLGAWVRPHLGL
jgi:acetyl esterase/lipase